MSNEFEIGREGLKELGHWYAQIDCVGKRNEATTRLHLIDQIFFRCLGWLHEDCAAEESEEGTFADYIFSNPRRCLIVEAKREGIYFEVPTGFDGIEYKLESLCKDNIDFKKAIDQVMMYCQTRGVPIAVVSNGHQLVAFLANRMDGINPMKGIAIVYSSIDHMLKNFLSLWNFLSKSAVRENQLVSHLTGNEFACLPSKMAENISGYPGKKNRNPLQSDLLAIADMVIEEATRAESVEKKFLTECYCLSNPLSQYAAVSKSFLKARYEAIFDKSVPGPSVTDAVGKKGLNKEFFDESYSNRPILLLGDVGVGKTTFIKWLIHVEGAEVMKDAIALYVDLGSKAALASDLKEFFLFELSEQLRTKHNVDIEEKNFVTAVYHGDMQRFDSGIFGSLKESNIEKYNEKLLMFLEEKLLNKEVHLKKSFEHI